MLLYVRKRKMTKYIIIKTQAYNNHALAFSFPDKRLFDDKDEALAYVTNTLIPDEIEFRKSLEDEQYVEDRPEYKQTKYFLFHLVFLPCVPD